MTYGQIYVRLFADDTSLLIMSVPEGFGRHKVFPRVCLSVRHVFAL